MFSHTPSIVVRLPKPTGNYGVGTKAIEVIDKSRIQPYGSIPRRFMVQAFYPTDNVLHKTAPYMPGTLLKGEIGGVEVQAHAEVNGLVSKKGPFPVIFFQHGLGGMRQDCTILCEDLASHGYIVLSLDQPYNSSFVRFLDGTTIVMKLYDIYKVAYDRDYRYAFYDKMMKIAMKDIQFLLNELASFVPAEFFLQCNMDTIGIMGHSFGGNVAHTLGFQDPKIRAIVDLDSKITERKILGSVGPPSNPNNLPVLFIRSNQYQEDVGTLLKTIKGAETISFDVQHSAFKDIAYLAPHISSQSLLQKVWLWVRGRGPFFDKSIDTDLAGFTPDVWFELIRNTIVTYFDKQLK